ncbi:hypothetical protein MHL31_00445 [Lutibacter sp. A80]|uniref:hypothetical protein n=1 Tax=Lutibacter sp. A80 TaxID=2918453 RepID=UPI001F052E83|nr:hypothetical protein [Lutibacter sp. A80]UMB60697.1 hypothetical protein MHL31_00445 [Lutibacter sp. A80]
MPLKSNYKILLNYNLIVEYHEDALDINSYRDFKTKLIEDPLYSKHLNYIINFKNVDFNISSNDIDSYVEHLKQIPKILSEKKLAFITRTPNQIVPATLYKMKQNELNQKVEIFSTYESALDWLNIDLTPENLDIVYKELKKINAQKSY